MNKKMLFAMFLLLFLAGCSKNQITGTTTLDLMQEASCPGVEIDFVEINGRTIVCHEDGLIRFNIENVGQKIVKGVFVKADSEKTIMKELSTGEIISGNVAYALNPGIIEASPIAKNGVICTSNKVIYDGIEACN